MEQIPRAGEFYRHFKDRLYQIITVAVHTETGEQMVVYQALYGDFKTYVRPLSMFMSDVDRVKYPNISQQKRFEPISPYSVPQKEISKSHPCLMRFMDETDDSKRLQLLTEMKGELSQKDLHMIDTVLDMEVQDGSLEEQYESIKKQLEIKVKYLGTRLR